MTTPPQITIPRLDAESARAYAARVAYVTMGPQRSIDKVTGQIRGKSGVRSTTLEDWSSKFDWVDHARRYDDAVAHLAIQEAAAQHRAALEAHRTDALKVGAELIALGRALAGEVAARRASLEYKPSDLATAVKAILAGFDLKAHALDLPRLMAALEAPNDD